MRRALAGLWAIVSLAVLLVAMVLLPPPAWVPTGWTGATPDAFASGPGFSSAILTVTVICVIAAAATSVLSRIVPPLWGRWLLTVASGVAWGAVLVYLVTVWRAQVDGPEQVHQGWAVLALVGGLGAAAVAYLVHGTRVPSPSELDDLIPERSRVRPVRGRGVRPVEPWATQMSSTTLRVIGTGVLVVFALLLVFMVVTAEAWVLILLVLVAGLLPGVLALAWSRVRVSVDPGGLHVHSMVLPLRVATVGVDTVAGVEVQELDPMRWGGVGLRVLPDRTAYIVGHGGPGIVIYKRDGRRLALQITEGDEVARVGARTLLQAAGQRLGEEPTS